jgi:hypothetical protein
MGLTDPELSSTNDRSREPRLPGFSSRLNTSQGVLFTIFGPGGQKKGEFPQELDPDWSDFEHFWLRAQGIDATLALSLAAGV